MEIDRPGFKEQRADRSHGREPTPVQTWDFVLTFGNGRVVNLHPNWNNNKVSASIGTPTPGAEVPRDVLGGTNGKGTFRRFSQKGYNTTLKFRS